MLTSTVAREGVAVYGADANVRRGRQQVAENERDADALHSVERELQHCHISTSHGCEGMCSRKGRGSQPHGHKKKRHAPSVALMEELLPHH